MEKETEKELDMDILCEEPCALSEVVPPDQSIPSVLGRSFLRLPVLPRPRGQTLRRIPPSDCARQRFVHHPERLSRVAVACLVWLQHPARLSPPRKQISCLGWRQPTDSGSKQWSPGDAAPLPTHLNITSSSPACSPSFAISAKTPSSSST
jgi:hypothetical protein